MGKGNGDAGTSYTPAEAAFPPTETHKRRERGPDSHALAVFFTRLCVDLVCCWITPSFHSAQPVRPV